jgi:hypothetical protein
MKDTKNGSAWYGSRPFFQDRVLEKALMGRINLFEEFRGKS